MKERLEQIKAEAIRQINESEALDKLNDVRVSFLGKKGELTTVLKGMKDVAPEDRPKVGQLVNEARAEIERVLDEARTNMERKLREARMKAEVIDVTLPAQKNSVGHRHPNTIALEEVERIFIGMGYEVVPRWRKIIIISRRSTSRQIIRQRMSRIHFTLTVTFCSGHKPPVYRCMRWKKAGFRYE